MTTQNSRRGITIMELMVVIAIVSMLIALVAGAVFKVRETQEKSFTELTIQKLGLILNQQVALVVEQARKEYDTLPSAVKTNLLQLADNFATVPPTAAATPPQPRAADRAKLLYIKFRLKQEFPVSFSQVLTQGQIPGVTGTVIGPDRFSGVATPQYLPMTTVKIDTTTFNTTAKPAYFTALQSVVAVGKPLPSPDNESAVLLAMALEQPRGGAAKFDLEQSIGSRFLANENGFRYPIDAWGRPLQFFLFPAYPFGQGPSTTDLDILCTTSTPSKANFNFAKETPDSQDGEHLLQDFSSWTTYPANAKWTCPTITNTSPAQGAMWPISAAVPACLLHPQVQPAGTYPPTAGQFINRRMVPVIASSGPDGDLGGATPAGDASKSLLPNPFMALPNSGSADNIYSFRLRQAGARGN